MKLRSDTLWLAILDKVAHFRQKGCFLVFKRSLAAKLSREFTGPLTG